MRLILLVQIWVTILVTAQDPASVSDTDTAIAVGSELVSTPVLPIDDLIMIEEPDGFQNSDLSAWAQKHLTAPKSADSIIEPPEAPKFDLEKARMQQQKHGLIVIVVCLITILICGTVVRMLRLRFSATLSNSKAVVVDANKYQRKLNKRVSQ